MILINTFRGMRPRLDKRTLEANQAQLAQNCILTSGKMRPLRNTVQTGSSEDRSLRYAADDYFSEDYNLPVPGIGILSKPGLIQTIYLFGKSFWFHWAADVDVVKGQIPTDTTERTYWTGDGFPKVTQAGMATSGGGTNYPTNHYRLGIPAPQNAPFTQLQASQEPIDQEKFEFHIYVFTFVSAWEEEGPPSPASPPLKRNYQENGNLQGVNVTMGSVPSGPFNIAIRRLYRANTTSDGGVIWQLLAEMPAATNTYTDVTANENLSTTLLPSIEWDMPPETMKGLINMPNGMMAGFDGFDVYFCEAFRPHAWPTRYIQPLDYPIVGLGSFGTTLVVCTEGHPYVGTGSDPESILLSKIALPQACVSKRSIATMGLEGVVYASPDGLVLIGPSSAGLITEALFSREEWQALNPASMSAYHHDGAYIAFYQPKAGPPGCIIFDRRMEGVVLASIHASAGYVDLETDALYLVRNTNQLHRWDTGSALTALWKSARQVLGLANPAAAKVVADGYPVTFKLYGDGELRHTQTVSSALPFRLPGGYMASEWEVEVSGTVQINEVRVGRMDGMR